MENSTRYGLMAVFAVSGSMVFLVHQVHKRLLSNFMKKFEHEVGGVLYSNGRRNLGSDQKHQGKKKVRFAEEVIQVPAIDGEKWRGGSKLQDIPANSNRAVLYRGIIKERALNQKLHF